MEFKARETFDNVTAAATTRKSIRAAYAGLYQLLTGLILVTVGGGGFGDITTNQVLVIAVAVLGAAGAVYGLTNKD